MNTDLNELKDLVGTIKSDRQAQKEKEQRESWTKYVSLSLVCLAVLAGIATQRGGGYSSATLKQLNEATYNQANASDQWTFFQAKSIKQNLYETEADQLKLAPNPDAKLIEKITAKIEKYENEKKDITKVAKEFEKKRDDARAAATRAAEHSTGMGLAITVFQVAVALGGICLVVKKRWLWWTSLAIGSLAIMQMIKMLNMPM